MVKLTRIYTRSGDDGSTGLGDGSRVPKTHPRVAAYGAVDEANSALGIALAHAPAAHELIPLLRSIQNELFDVGADLCLPIPQGGDAKPRLRITAAQTKRLEDQVDHFNARLAPLDSFILPGGSPLAAHLHLARTICRRAERDAARLLELESASVNPETLRYLNRLSDLLFVLARIANDDGAADVKWTPGAGR